MDQKDFGPLDKPIYVADRPPTKQQRVRATIVFFSLLVIALVVGRLTDAWGWAVTVPMFVASIALAAWTVARRRRRNRRLTGSPTTWPEADLRA